MKRAIFVLNRTLTIVAGATLLVISAFAQAAGQPPARPTTKGAVLKDKAPVNKEVLKVKLPKPYETKLSNGLQVLVLEDHKLPQFSMQMVMLSGGMADAAALPGAAQYTATLLREGTKTRDSKKIAEQLDQLGASIFANSGLASISTNVSASGLIDNFDAIMELFADVLLNPSFPADELNKLKMRNISQLRLQRSQPGFLSNEMFAKVMYGSHPAARTSLSAEQIQRLTPEALQQFQTTHYKPNNAIFAIVGDVKPAAVIAKLEKTFAAWQPGDVPKTEIPKVADTGASKIYLIDRPGSVQTNLLLGTHTIERTDPDYFALEMMNQVLGGGPSARLFMNLREDKGYTYGAYSNVSSFKYRGRFQANTEVRSDVTDGSMKELLAEFQRIREEQVPTTEFERAKRTIVGGWALQLESPASSLQNAITSKLYGLPADYWDTYPQKIAAITTDDVQRVARKYINLDKLQIIAVGDGSKITDVLKKYGTVEIYDTEGKPKKAAAPATTTSVGSNSNAGTAAFVGNWNLSVKTPDGEEIPVKAKIKLDGENIVGSLESPMGDSQITSGEVKGEEVKFKAVADMGGQKVELQFTGKLSGNSLKGTISAEGAGIPPLDVTGTKEK